MKSNSRAGYLKMRCLGKAGSVETEGDSGKDLRFLSVGQLEVPVQGSKASRPDWSHPATLFQIPKQEMQIEYRLREITTIV